MEKARVVQAKQSDFTKIYKGEVMVAVPLRELKKLESARVDLYHFLGDKLNYFEMSQLSTITGQIWKVANKKRW